MPILPKEFYHHPNVVYLSKQLLGKYLFTNFSDKLTGGMIIETEAYRGPEDRASHAFNNRKTKRNQVIYEAGGIAYVYLIYGLHYLFNVVTNVPEMPHAILIRSIKPEIGIEEMLRRRNQLKLTKTLTSGPGTLTQALGINLTHNGLPLERNLIWIEDRGVVVKDAEIICGPRVGVDYAGEDALLPWRFILNPS